MACKLEETAKPHTGQRPGSLWRPPPPLIPISFFFLKPFQIMCVHGV